MPARMRLEEVAPEGYRTVMELHAYARATVDPVLLELVKLRASMVNRCAYCVDTHSTEATEAGEDPRRLFALAAWRETPFFSARERAALALTDAVTRVADAGVPDDVWDEVTRHFTEKEAADLVMAIIMMNSFNRIAISTRKVPAVP
ncbi:carboxymuconolactone decarboxylase family protein [Auraticoccus monumenti]|uniref:Alkylhydroperoxidase AhpD family core domain-containing protein n=1 Tax=Auraticoccus monumenti TaxID=675864 RepID=A0A1G7A1I1_9ACTN|nr:carboxymuconolactone decarboxylase family protein [Auraticoccus monumenti]SDE08630.1 alkylhydroperoxidase AhpD family core domain-containing protein [Auraticoccus monumenti]